MVCGQLRETTGTLLNVYPAGVVLNAGGVREPRGEGVIPIGYMGQVYLARLDAALGRAARRSEVMDALYGTPENRRAVKEMSSGGFTADPAPREATESVDDLSEQSREP